MKGLLAKLRRWLGLSRPWDLFISHAHEDAACAVELAEAARSVGLIPWLDKDDLRYTEEFSEKITQAINDSSVFVLLLSRTALGKPFVSHETSQAIAYSVPIVPVFLADFKDEKLKTPFDHAARLQGPVACDGLTPERCAEIAHALTHSRRRLRLQALALRSAILAVLILTAVLVFRPQHPRVASSVFVKRAGGNYTTLRSGESLPTGAYVKVFAEPQTPGYLYIFWKDATGKIEPLYPAFKDKHFSSGGNPTAKGATFCFPPEGKETKLTPPQGTEEIFVMLSRRPLPEIETALATGNLLNLENWISLTPAGSSAPKAKGFSEPAEEVTRSSDLLGQFKLQCLQGRSDVALAIHTINHVPREKE